MGNINVAEVITSFNDFTKGIGLKPIEHIILSSQYNTHMRAKYKIIDTENQPKLVLNEKFLKLDNEKDTIIFVGTAFGDFLYQMELYPYFKGKVREKLGYKCLKSEEFIRSYIASYLDNLFGTCTAKEDIVGFVKNVKAAPLTSLPQPTEVNFRSNIWDEGFYVGKTENGLMGLVEEISEGQYKWLTEPKAHSIYKINKNVYLIWEDRRYRFVDNMGKPLSNLIFEAVDVNWVAYQRQTTQLTGYIPVKCKGLWGYLDTNFTWKITPRFEKAYRFCGSTACVIEDGWYGFIDKNGRYVIPNIHKWVLNPIRDERCPIIADGKNGLYGFLDVEGNWILKPQFIKVADRAYDYPSYTAIVQSANGKWGVCGENGEFLIDPVFDYLEGLDYINTATGYVATHGELVGRKDTLEYLCEGWMHGALGLLECSNRQYYLTNWETHKDIGKCYNYLDFYKNANQIKQEIEYQEKDYKQLLV
jgi:hypothetical protein